MNRKILQLTFTPKLPSTFNGYVKCDGCLRRIYELINKRIKFLSLLIRMLPVQNTHFSLGMLVEVLLYCRTIRYTTKFKEEIGHG